MGVRDERRHGPFSPTTSRASIGCRQLRTDPFVVREVVPELVEVIQPQHTPIQQLKARIQMLEARIAELEARVQQHSRHADRPPLVRSAL
jgi:uncharacterized protein YceH (UPF0502 family)